MAEIDVIEADETPISFLHYLHLFLWTNEPMLFKGPGIWLCMGLFNNNQII